MNNSQDKKYCPVCSLSDYRHIVRIEHMPVLCNYLLESVEEAQAVPRGNIDLVLCQNCSHIYNSGFDQDSIDYRPGYENSLHYSSRYHTYAVQQAKRLINTYNLSGCQVVDIGCGSGDFLKLFSELGNCTGSGFDLATDPNVVSDDPRVRLIPDTFSDKYFDIQANCYISRHVLEHLSDPVRFLQTIRSAMNNKETVFFIEIPNGENMLEECYVWDIIYEHYSYFTPESLQYLLAETRFDIAESGSTFGGQYLTVDAFAAQANKSTVVSTSDRASITHYINLAEKFSLQCKTRYTEVEKLLRNEKQRGSKVILWGAGSKGIAFLNQLNDSEMIKHVIDINPKKHEKYIPGSGQQVMAPEFLLAYQPDVVLIMNEMYRKEIQTSLDSLGVSSSIKSI